MKDPANKRMMITHIVACYLWGGNRLAIWHFASADELFSDIPGLVFCAVFFLIVPLVVSYITYFRIIKHGQLSKGVFWTLNILDAETIVSVIVMARIAFTTHPSYIGGFIVLYAYHLVIIIPRIIVDIKTYKHMT